MDGAHRVNLTLELKVVGVRSRCWIGLETAGESDCGRDFSGQSIGKRNALPRIIYCSAKGLDSNSSKTGLCSSV